MDKKTSVDMAASDRPYKITLPDPKIMQMVEEALNSNLGNLHADVAKKVSKEIASILEDQEIRKYRMIRNLLDSFTDEMVNFQDENHVILYCNDAFAKFIGLPKEEIIGKKCSDVLCEPEKCYGNCPIEGIKSGSNSRYYVDYGGKYIEKTANIVNDEEGNFLGYVELYRDRSDVIEKKLALNEKNKELSRTNEYLTSALNNSKQGAWEWNAQTGEVIADDNFYQMLGYHKDEVIFDYGFWEMLIHPEDKPEIMDELKRCIKKPDGSFQFTYRLLNAVGEYIWLTVSGKVIESDDKGRPIKAIGTQMNITEITNIKSYLYENEQKLSALLKYISDLLIVLDQNGNYKQIVTENPKISIGPRKSGLNVGDVFDDKNAKIIKDCIRKVIETGKSQHLDYVLDINGKSRWFSGNCQILSKELGEVVIVTRDVTKEKKLQEKDKKLQEKIKHMAMHDSLTGLYNHFSFNDKLQHTINLSKRTKKPFAVLFIDLDFFKQANDTHGHAVGDKLLQEVAGRLLSSTRGSDIVSRIGGDEFATILTNLENPKDYEIVAQRIVNSLSQPFKIRGNDINIGSSIGISVFPEHGEDAPTLLKHADVAMYWVKKGGKNDYYVYDIHKDSK